MKFKSAVLALSTIVLAFPAHAGKILLTADEWATSDTGYASSPANSATYVENLAKFFKPVGAGNFLVYSEDFSLTEASFLATLAGAGHTVTNYTTIPGFTFDLATLLTYDAVFLSSKAASNAVLSAYVMAGGGVFLQAGSCPEIGPCDALFGATAEAAQWNPFLADFGLILESAYLPFTGNAPIASAHPVLAGVTELYQNGIQLIGVNPLEPNAMSIQGPLYAVFDDVSVPEPSTVFVVVGALAGIIGARRRLSWIVKG